MMQLKKINDALDSIVIGDDFPIYLEYYFDYNDGENLYALLLKHSKSGFERLIDLMEKEKKDVLSNEIIFSKEKFYIHLNTIASESFPLRYVYGIFYGIAVSQTMIQKYYNKNSDLVASNVFTRTDHILNVFFIDILVLINIALNEHRFNNKGAYRASVWGAYYILMHWGKRYLPSNKYQEIDYVLKNSIKQFIRN